MKITVGITGKTGAGKSTVSEIFKERGAFVIDGDIVASKITSSPEVLNALAEAFGREIIASDGALLKKDLARRAFKDEISTALLNSITHPAINAEIERLCREGFISHDVCVVDAAAIIESGFYKKCDVLLVICAPPEVRLKRIMARDAICESDALLRMNAQKADEWYESRADYVLINDGTDEAKDMIIKTVDKLFTN